MSAARTFFRHCPSCGRRFEIRLIGKEQVDSEVFREERRHPEISGGSFSPIHTVVQADTPAIVQVEEFQYRYRCKHCGHQWTEVRETTKEIDEPKE